eukprot:734593-Prorocentrum_lima.AAC.1
MIPELHAILRPWGWVLENVANFATLQEGEYAEALRSTMAAMNMNMHAKVLDLQDVLPLKRRRW